MLQGHCTAMTEYTGTAHGVDDPTQSKVVGQDRLRGHPVAGEERAGHRHVHLRHRVGREEPGRCGRSSSSGSRRSKVQTGVRGRAAARPSPGRALRDPALSKKYRWLPAIADAVDNSIPKPRTPDEPKMEDLLGTALNQALVQAISQKSGYQQIAQSHLTTAANQITAYLKQQGTYF